MRTMITAFFFAPRAALAAALLQLPAPAAPAAQGGPRPGVPRPRTSAGRGRTATRLARLSTLARRRARRAAVVRELPAAPLARSGTRQRSLRRSRRPVLLLARRRRRGATARGRRQDP